MDCLVFKTFLWRKYIVQHSLFEINHSCLFKNLEQNLLRIKEPVAVNVFSHTFHSSFSFDQNVYNISTESCIVGNYKDIFKFTYWLVSIKYVSYRFELFCQLSDYKSIFIMYCCTSSFLTNFIILRNCHSYQYFVAIK